MTLVQLGRACGLSHPFLSQVERGLAKPGIDSVSRIAAALGVSESRLWSGSPAVGQIRFEPSEGRIGAGAEAEGECGASAEVVIHALQGAAEVGIEDRLSIVEEGETISLRGDFAHTVRLLGPGPSRLIYISAALPPPGQS